MKSLIWQSVMWRPGKARFLIDMKNPLPIRPAPTARQHGPLRGRAVRQIRDVSRATPSLRHASGDTFSSRLTRASHPDRRAAPAIAAGKAVKDLHVEIDVERGPRVAVKRAKRLPLGPASAPQFDAVVLEHSFEACGAFDRLEIDARSRQSRAARGDASIDTLLRVNP